MSLGETQDSNQKYFATGASQPMEIDRFLLGTARLSSTRLGAGDTHQVLHDTEASKSLRIKSNKYRTRGCEPLSMRKLDKVTETETRVSMAGHAS